MEKREWPISQRGAAPRYHALGRTLMYIIHNYMHRTDLEWLSVVKRDIESYCVYIHVHVLYMYLACNINVYIQYSSRGT